MTLFCRLRSCDAVVRGRQGVLYCVRRHWYTTDADHVYGIGRTSDGFDDETAAGADRFAGPPLQDVTHTADTPEHHLGHPSCVHLPHTISDLLPARGEVELSRRVLLLLHLDDHHRPRRLHTGGRHEPETPPPLQDLHHV